MNAQFAVGEIAIVALSHFPDIPVGSEVTIAYVGISERPDLLCPCCGGSIYGLQGTSVVGCDRTLRKRRPPAQDWIKLCDLDRVLENA